MTRPLANLGAAVLLTGSSIASAAERAQMLTVTNAAQLTSALASARGGEIIRLAPGVYSDLGHLKGLNFASAVTITSGDPSRPAVIAPFYLYNSSNIRFANLEFSAAGSTDPHAYRIYDSKNIAFDHDVFHGDLDAPASAAPMNGVTFFSSANVSITNSQFTRLNHGIGNAATDGAIFSNNSFYEMRCDGMDITSSKNIVVERNVFTEFHPSAGDHPDAIQLWGPGSHDIKISGNLSVRGSGASIQGVFLNDNPGWVHNVTIESNVIVGGGYNAIDVTGADGINVSSNTVAPFPDQESWIRLEGNTGGKESGNVSFMYIFRNNSKISQADNRTGRSVSDGGKALVSRWLAAHPGWTGTLPPSLSHLVGAEPAGGSGGGGAGRQAAVGYGSAPRAAVDAEPGQDFLSFDPVLFTRTISGLAARAAAGDAGL